MLLDEDLNILIGKMIGLINGLSMDPKLNELEPELRKTLFSIKNGEDIKPLIDKFIELKKTFLPNCVVCASPCGRSNDCYLNDFEEPKRTDKINELNKFIADFNDSMSLHDIEKGLVWLTY